MGSKKLADMTAEERAASAAQAFQGLMDYADRAADGKQKLYIRHLRQMADAVARFPIGSQYNGKTVVGYTSPKFGGVGGFIKFDGGDQGVLVLGARDVLAE